MTRDGTFWRDTEEHGRWDHGAALTDSSRPAWLHRGDRRARWSASSTALVDSTSGWPVWSDPVWEHTTLSPESLRGVKFRECIWRGYSRPQVDDLLERVAVRMEASQAFLDLVQSPTLTAVFRGYEADDVDRVLSALGGSSAKRQPPGWLPLGRAAAVPSFRRIAAGVFGAALLLILLGCILSSKIRSDFWPLLGIEGIGAVVFGLGLMGFARDEPFSGYEVRGLLIAGAFVIGGIGGAINGMHDNASWGKLGAVAVCLLGIPSLAVYCRKIWIYFRDPPPGRHSAPREMVP